MTCDDVCRRAVVVYCHKQFDVMGRFLFRAQDQGMTDGDFAYFTWRPMRSTKSDQPWKLYAEDSSDLPLRRRAFYAVKQVPVVKKY